MKSDACVGVVVVVVLKLQFLTDVRTRAFLGPARVEPQRHQSTAGGDAPGGHLVTCT